MPTPIYGYNCVVPEPISTSEQTPLLHTNFNTPEGVYRQAMTVNEYFRSNRMPNQVAGPVCNAPVRVSFLRVPTNKKMNCTAEEALPSTSNNDEFFTTSSFPEEGDGGGYVERICFNIGREIFVFDYSGINSATDSAKPLDKRVYKGTFPTCHDFNKANASLTACLLLIGFSAGQIQMIDPSQKEQQNSKLFNEERQIDRTAVTCLRWVPDGRSLFISAHASGNFYVYNEEIDSPQIAPSYQVIKQSEDFTVFGGKAKAARNPLYRWQIGTGAINALEFAGDSANFLATVSQDGFLRVFNWKTMELIGCMKSYFGGLLCLAWSPDLRYIATGGEDDMLSLYSVAENRVICRGQSHKSWISEVAFDHFAMRIFSRQNDCEGGAFDSTLMDGDEIVLAPTSESLVVHNNAVGSSSNQYSPNCRNNIGDTGSQSQPNHHQHQQQLSKCGYYQHLEQNGVGPRRAATNNAVDPHNNVNLLPSSSNSFKLYSPTELMAEATTAGGELSAPFHPFNNLSAMASGGDSGGEEFHQSRLIYRIGTVGHDCQLCLWDISEEMLQPANSPPFSRSSRTMADLATDASSPVGGAQFPSDLLMHPRGTTVIPIGIDNAITVPNSRNEDGKSGTLKSLERDRDSASKNDGGSRFKRLHKRGLSLGSRLTGNDRNRQNGASSNGGGVHSVDSTLRRGERMSNQLFGTPQCPRIEEVPVIEPLICKKVANERLGSLHFREDCIVTACQEGYICTWARPSVHCRQDGRQANLSMSDCPNDCHYMSADNFASTCV